MATRTPLPTRRPRVEPDHPVPPAGVPERTDAHAVPLTGLVRSLAEDVQTLLRQEVELAKAEATRTAKRVAIDSAWVGAGAAIGAVGGVVVVVALALGLGVLMGSYWLGTLVAGGLLLVIGAGVAWKGAKDLRSRELAPKRTVESLREDAEWAKREAREFKDEIQRSI